MPSYNDYLGYLSRPEVRATLDTIAWAEGANYNTLYGGGTFTIGGPHPNRAITAGRYTSTAAGRYQFLKSTWDSLGLANMSETNQDIGALMLINRRGALDEILAGDFAGALRSGALGREWASLPYSPYGQTNRTESQVLNYYNNALAALGGVGATVPVNVNTSPASLFGGTNNTVLIGLALLLFVVLVTD